MKKSVQKSKKSSSSVSLKEPSERNYSPSQAERDLASIDRMYENGVAAIMTPEVRNKLKQAVCQRLADSV